MTTLTEQRIIFFTFAGRKANMEIQRPYIERLLAAYPTAELHLWDLTREADDHNYIMAWADSHAQVAYVGHLHPGHPYVCLGDYRGAGHPRCVCIKHKPPYEEPYRYYRNHPHRGSRVPDCNDDTVFVKFDDDVLWMDVDQFGEVMSFLETHPSAVASANVTNNAVCAKYEPSLRDLVQSRYNLPGTTPDQDRNWWSLHTSADFAMLSHGWHNTMLVDGFRPPDREPVRTRSGEAISINFIAMKYPVLRAAAHRMRSGRLGDEGTFDQMLPWIIPNFRVAHLSFGPQEHDLDPQVTENIRKQYRIEGDI